MSEATNPVKRAFELQRTAVEQTHEAVRRTTDAQRRAIEMSMDGFQSSRTLGEDGIGFLETALNAYFDGLEDMMPEGETAGLDAAREAAAESFDQLEALNEEAWEAATEAMEEGLDAYNEATDVYVEAVDDSFDAFLDAHEQMEHQVTEATEVAADAVEIDVEAQ